MGPKHSLGSESESKSEESDFQELHVDAVFQVQGVGVVVSGNLLHGSIRVGDHMFLGPYRNGDFTHVIAKSIHRQCVPCDQVFSGQQCTVAVKSLAKDKVTLKKATIRKGTVLISHKTPPPRYPLKVYPSTVREFEAEVKVLHHSTTIVPGYSPMIHLGVVRQSAKIVSIDVLKPSSTVATATSVREIRKENKSTDNGEHLLRTGGEARVVFRFQYHGEFLTLGRVLIFREGRAKGIGRVTAFVK